MRNLFFFFVKMVLKGYNLCEVRIGILIIYEFWFLMKINDFKVWLWERIERFG